MLAGVQPCFQLLRIGSSAGDSARDLYTFRPALSQSLFRLGRAPELCDVTLDSESVSRIHAELHAEKVAGGGDAAELEEEGWRVHIKDRSSHGNRDTHRCASTSQSETSALCSTVKVEEKGKSKVKHPLTRNISTATGKHILRVRHCTPLTFHSPFTDSGTRLET